MELEKFEKAKKLLNECGELKKCLRTLEMKAIQTSLEPLIIYDGWSVDGNHSLFSIPQPLANEVKCVLKNLLLQRIEFLENEFKNI